MTCGFQANAFQNDAFQVCYPIGADSFAGGDNLDERMWRQLPVEEEKEEDILPILLAAYREYYQ